MTCLFCQVAIEPDDVNMHHPVYRSKGGRDTRPSHKACHRSFHSSQGDFREWGKLGGQITAITRLWAFNLRGVKDHPAYDFDRAYYVAYYAR